MYYRTQENRSWITDCNPVFVLLYIVFLIVVRTTFEMFWPGALRNWDILLPVVIYLGQRRSVIEGLTLVALIVHFYSLCSSADLGIYVIHYVFVFIISRLIANVIFANNFSTVLGFLLVFGLFSRISIPLISRFFGGALVVMDLTHFSIGGFCLSTGLGLLIYLSLGTLDELTHKVSPINIRLGGEDNAW